MLEEKKRYKAVCFAIFLVAAGLALLRIGVFGLVRALESAKLSELKIEYITDTVFTLLSQVGVCLLAPFLVYKIYQKRGFKQILSDANVKRVKWWVPLLCVPLAIGVYLITIIVSILWINYLISTGYNYNPGSAVFPEKFNPLLFLLSVVLTGVLPAICEEFAMRGNFLTAMRHTFRFSGVVLISALAFGLFHQNILQVFYTSVFGALAAFLVIKTGSVIPAVVIHFVNNTFSVYLSHDGQYGWGLAKAMDSMIADFYGIPLFVILGAGLVAGCLTLILRQAKKDNSEIPVLMLYKPTLRESAWLIGALAITVLSTAFTYMFGL